MKYKEYKETISKEINEFMNTNCIWAFSKEQLEQALKERNLTQEQFQNEYCDFIVGGAIRKDKVKEYLKICMKQHTKLKELLNDEKFAYDALYYELANHEYGYTGNETPALETLGLTEDDIAENPVLKRAFRQAVQEIRKQEL